MNTGKYSWLERTWYGDSPVYWLLLPLTGLFSILSSMRRFFYRVGLLTTQRVDVPVVVVGNIAVGGTGKTPITIWLVKELLQRGLKPAIISRGYRGNVGPFPWEATEDSDAAVVGDEAVMLARQCECPVIVHPDRVAAARMAIEQGADILVADDGLQHYRLHRDVEIAVVDGVRRFGNGTLLPAGPLREAVSRLETADIVMVHQETEVAADAWVMQRETDPQPFNFHLEVAAVARLDNTEGRELSDFAGKTVHAVAGIGRPERFFRMLEANGITVYRHPLPDHADIAPDDIHFDDELDVLMTEKDAVKCQGLDTAKCWYVSVAVDFDDGIADTIANIVFQRIRNQKAELK